MGFQESIHTIEHTIALCSLTKDQPVEVAQSRVNDLLDELRTLDQPVGDESWLDRSMRGSNILAAVFVAVLGTAPAPLRAQLQETLQLAKGLEQKAREEWISQDDDDDWDEEE